MLTAAKKIPGVVVSGLVAAIVLDTVIQVAWKKSVADVSGEASFARTIAVAVANPFFYVAMIAFAAQFVNWLQVLKRADLSFAQPFTALSYVSVLGLSSRTLHETISVPRIVGVALILIGVFFISRTPFRTAEGKHLS